MIIENWANHEIRFVEYNDEWCAVAKDVTSALGFARAKDGTKRLPDKYKGVTKVPTTSAKTKAPDTQEMIVLNEKGLYRLIMRSNKPEAEAFQDWVFDVLKELRQSSGLEGFEIWRMVKDIPHQKEIMANLQQGLKKPKRIDFIKANTITNKAVSAMYGYPKSLKKGDMTPEMLISREPILEDTVKLMSACDAFDLKMSVSQTVYQKYGSMNPS